MAGVALGSGVSVKVGEGDAVTVRVKVGESDGRAVGAASETGAGVQPERIRMKRRRVESSFTGIFSRVGPNPLAPFPRREGGTLRFLPFSPRFGKRRGWG